MLGKGANTGRDLDLLENVEAIRKEEDNVRVWIYIYTHTQIIHLIYIYNVLHTFLHLQNHKLKVRSQ